MAVANEYIHSTFNHLHRPSQAARVRATGNSTGLDTLRQTVRNELLDSLDVRPGEVRLDIEMAGDGANPGRNADVVVADLEMIHLDNSRRAARDLLRACRPNGRIGIACPAPGSFLAELHARIDAYTAREETPSNRGFAGTRKALDALFGPSAIALGAIDRTVTLDFSSAEHWLAEWQVSYAPLKRAYEHIDPEWRAQFTNDLLHIAALFAEAKEGKLSIRCEYLEFIVHKGTIQ